MNQVEFGKKCRELNKKYHVMFGEVPSPSDYTASYEEYLAAMCKAVDEKKHLYDIIPLKKNKIDGWTS
ncbi:hypothetical protein G4313_07750 [Coprococcus eutactus]|jgi:hypothetical protein|nr:hypothetical protein [Coprococcus eutactus]